ncbi:MAG: hypothetical protein JO356_06000, partial [Acidobacteria bacterium]|nr:hypothetical protein [Acidobacteriota bacterium]
MFREKTTKVVLTLTATTLGVFSWLLLFHVSTRTHFFEPKHSNVRDLQDLPLGPVRLEGLVTYVDKTNKRFWLQDESGAIVINTDPAPLHVRVGQRVLLEASKTHRFDALVGLQSVALSVLRVVTLKVDVTLPSAAPATVDTLPDNDRNGIRVSVEGVLHFVSSQDEGFEILHFGESGHEIQAVVPSGKRDFLPWINSRVRISGVSEKVLDAAGSARSRYIWVPNDGDVQKIEKVAPQDSLYSVRSLYQLRNEESGHRVLLRGQVETQDGATRLLVEDEWGAVSCDFDIPLSMARGATVEVAGFPVRSGLRVDLVHSKVMRVESRGELNHQAPIAPLTTIVAVRKLTEQQANSTLPVKLTGVVTFNDGDWQQLFLQDATGGIFVKYAGHQNIFTGEKLTIIGLTNPGDYAPVIVAPRFIVHGAGALPRPVAMTAKAWSGTMDGILVEAEGVIHPVQPRQNPRHLRLDLCTSFG